MIIRSKSHPGRHRIPRTLAGLLLLGAAVSGCDFITGGGGGGGVLGTWMASESGYTVYLDIGSDAVTSYEGLTDRCFTRETFQIVSRSGDTYTLRQSGQDFTFDVVF
ncbi:MAG: hypothetical protein GWM90_18075, partial [Gemmatimonadetes bacterium]|nr:hypothetical protein [Gemmatimonadota bacterium]NIQ56927.1 hypothetical protein [Gemmatimonadota bacterium]NIU77101.1 hypothetical protein [Gammaproteobacteria bacterium]NIX45930.1 hypothetical protein [Gemmatimonadota bacterium]NIY10251.1 hypothetical protein [Gemmatimonadota bacterium]